MFSKQRFWRRNKPGAQPLLDNGEQQKERPFIPPVQTKLNMGKPGDKYEREADHTADAVLSKTENPNAIQKMESEEEKVQTKPLSAGLTPFVQKQEAEEEPIQTMEESREEEPLQLQEEEEPLQMQEEEEEINGPIQAKTAGQQKRPSNLEHGLKKIRESGNPLPKQTKIEMETAFQADFSPVRIHTGAQADAMSRDLNAQAFTHGKDIYFKNGKFDNDSRKGKHLLAHELTHTLQQGAVKGKVSDSSAKGAVKTVQRKEISYRALTWKDFEGEAATDSGYDAKTTSGLNYRERGALSNKYAWDGAEEVVVTLTYDPSKVSITDYMETMDSWKLPWLTDDAAAKKKFGEDADIASERKSLLAHEQVHFKITHAIAKKYKSRLRKAVPTQEYVEKGKATSDAAAETFFDKVVAQKSAALQTALKAVMDAAFAEKDKIQSAYDAGTDHGQITDEQEKWQTAFEKTFEKALEKAKTKKGSTAEK